LDSRYLRFDSNFECGNLEMVHARSECEYDLHLLSDTNAPCRCQWFYFMVSNTRKDLTVRFNLLNVTKHPPFLKAGMRPLVFSERDYQAIYLAWVGKTEILHLSKTPWLALKSFGDRRIRFEGLDGETARSVGCSPRKSFSTLAFTHTFKYDDDRVYFAFWKPYSYTRLHHFCLRCEANLRQDPSHHPVHANRRNLSTSPCLEGGRDTEKATKKRRNGKGKGNDKEKEKECWIDAETEIETRDIYYKREQLCLSMGGVPVDVLTITASAERMQGVPQDNRSYVVLTGRIHSGETAGSFKMQGLIKALLGKDPAVEALRREHIFLIVPMLNPDGVVLGNNRCSLAGHDLNRCWASPNRHTQPTVFQLKALLSELCTSRKERVLLYCDFHGHSHGLNSFIYACHSVANPAWNSWTNVRLLPRIFAKKCHMLNYQQCSFRVEPDKVRTICGVGVGEHGAGGGVEGV
jgi:hypothetical protein